MRKIFLLFVMVILLVFAGCSLNNRTSVLLNATNISSQNSTSVKSVNVNFSKMNLSEVCFPNASVVKNIFGVNADLSKYCILNVNSSVVSLNNSTNVLVNTTNINETVNSNTASKIFQNAAYLKTVVINETQAVNLTVQAYSPDGKKLSIYYSRPLNDHGFWQTKMGDYGTYIINVTVSDGHLNTTGKIRLIVKKLNLPPVVNLSSLVNISEGQIVNITPIVYDPDNNNLTVKYIGWLNKPVYKTTYVDAGVYDEKVIVSNGYHNVTKYVRIIVNNVDRRPVVNVTQVWNVIGGQNISLDVRESDPDNDTLTTTYFKPFNSKGIWDVPKLFNGTVHSKVVVSDGILNVTKNITVYVTRFNTAPYFVTNDAVISENTTLNFTAFAKDAENDAIHMTVSGDLNSSEHYFNFSSAGVYNLTLKACDYEYCNVTNFTLTVKNVNRPPVVNITQDYTIEETDTLKPFVQAYDPDGNNVTIICSAPFVNCTFKTNYSSAGVYHANISVSDGITDIVYPVNITVLNKDRPPVISNISDMTVKEGETIHISPVVTDPDNDSVTWKLVGWLTQPTYTTDYNDSGVYNETVIATDGDLTVNKNFTITVINVDRPPVITGVIVE